MRFILLVATLLVAVHPVWATPLTADEIARLFMGFEELESEPHNDYFPRVVQRIPHLPGYKAPADIRDRGQSVEKLIRRLKKNPYSPYDRISQTLIHRGETVLPILLKKLEGAEDYYRQSLLIILSGIHRPERDKAFVQQLERLLNEKRHFLADSMAETIIATLASRNYTQAAPLLKRFLEAEGMEPDIQAQARIGLSRLGALEPSDIAQLNYEVGSGFPAERAKRQIALLESLLKLNLLTTPLSLNEFESVEGAPTTVLRGTIEDGTWFIRIGKEDSGRIPVYYSWYTGFLSSAGYVGVMEKSDGEWRLVFWTMVWIS